MSPQGLRREDIETRIVKKALEDASFKKRLIENPKQVLQEELSAKEKGLQLPAKLNVRVLEETGNDLYIVIPRVPAGGVAGELSDQELEAVAGGRMLAASSGTVTW